MSQPPYPSVSTADNGKLEADFVKSVVSDYNNGGIEAMKIHAVRVLWHGKPRTFDLDASFTLADADEDQIRSKLMRLAGAQYLVWRDGNRCSIRSRFCTQGESAFEHPEGADFDHIDGNNRNHRLDNLRLACHSCNSHQQSLQRKSILLAATGRERESTQPQPKGVPANSYESAASIRMFPRTVHYLFHPTEGKLVKLGQRIGKAWLVGNLPEIVGTGRATTFGKYVSEFVLQGYVAEVNVEGETMLERTGKNADAMLERELGIHKP